MARLMVEPGSRVEAGGLRAVVYRSRRKTLSIQLRPDRGLVLRAPLDLPDAVLRDFLARHKGWVERQRTRLAAVPIPPREPAWTSGERLPFLGVELLLRVERGPSCRASISGGLLVARAPDPADREAVKRAVDRLYAREAALRLPAILEECLSLPEAAGLPRPQLRFRSMKSRWGSCDPARKILTLNTRLLRQSPEALRFVLMHELAHLRHRRHDAAFYDYLGRLCPGWERARSALAAVRP